MTRRVLVVLAFVGLCAPVATTSAHVGQGQVSGGASLASSQSGDVQHVTQLAGTTGGHVVIEGDRLYMGMYGVGMRIFDISQPAAPREIGRWEPADSVIGQTAVADAPPDAAVFDGRHIAVLNGTNRTSRTLPVTSTRTDNTYFLDTTDPANPTLLAAFMGVERPNDSESHNGDIVDSRRWWIASGSVAGGNGLRIYDLNPLLGEQPAAPAELFRGNPTTMWENSPHRGERPVGPAFTHTHDVTVYTDFEVGGVKRDIALLAEGGNYTGSGNTGSLFVIDITNPQAPVVLQRWLHESGPDHHPIRYHHEAQFLHGDPRVVLVTDEDLHNGCTAGGVTALRLSEDLTSATELSEWFLADGMAAGAAAFGPVCSVHVFSSHGNLAFFGSYSAGLQVVDYSDPADPRRVGHNTQLGADSWGAEYLRDGIVYVGDFGARGLDVFQVAAQPDLSVLSPTLVGGRAKRLSTTVANQGAVGSPAVSFEFRDGSTVLSRQTIPALAPGEQHEVSAPWPFKDRRERTITAIVDVEDRYDESSEANNQSSATLSSKPK